MQIRILTLRYNEALQGFPEDVIKAATFGREVLSLQEHFFVHGNVPHLTLVLSLGDTIQYENSSSYKKTINSQENLEQALDDKQKIVYRALKQWRNDTAKIEGRPAYAIARNVQLIELAKLSPKNISEIRNVEGFGDSFCEKYGKTIVDLFSNTKSKENEEK